MPNMESQSRVQIKALSFAHLVKQLKLKLHEADEFEVDIDFMKVKGDLAVIATYFVGKRLIGRTTSLDLAKRVVKSNWHAVRTPLEFMEDMEFQNLVKNKGVAVESILEVDSHR